MQAVGPAEGAAGSCPSADTSSRGELGLAGVEAQLEEAPELLTRDPGEVTRAALMGARGNSGVILSQIVRGAAEVLAASDDLARVFRSASA